MRKMLLFGLLTTVFCLLSEESHCQEALTVAGGDGSGSGGSFSYSIGQVSYSGSENGQLTEGVQQVYSVAVLFSDENHSDLNIDLEVYPNPTPDGIYLSIKNSDQFSLKYSLYQVNGSLLDQDVINSSLIRINLDELDPAVYILKVTDDSSVIKSFQIIKK